MTPTRPPWYEAPSDVSPAPKLRAVMSLVLAATWGGAMPAEAATPELAAVPASGLPARPAESHQTCLRAAADPALPQLAASARPAGVQGFIAVREGGGWVQRQRIERPAGAPTPAAELAFEGVGWESDKVAYRLYLDERNVVDVFGKRLPQPVLHRIGQEGEGDYHRLADWGMDVLAVGDSLGLGGLGVLRGGSAARIGRSAITTQVTENGPERVAVEVCHQGWDGGRAALQTRYVIEAHSPLTRVQAQATGAGAPMAAGFARHAAAALITSPAPLPEAGRGWGWGYIASWGKQSLAGDQLGLAVFYPADAIARRGDDGKSAFVEFKNSADIRYAFAAVWEQDGNGVRDEQGFRRFLDATVKGLDSPAPSPPSVR